MTAPTTLQPVHLQHTTDGHHKEYRIVLDFEAATVTTHWGAIGFPFHTLVKEFETGSAAMDFAEAKLAEKLDKGYLQVDETTAVTTPRPCTLDDDGPAPVQHPADDDRKYLVMAFDCNSDFLGLVRDETGLSRLHVTGTQALLDTLLSLKTGWYRDPATYVTGVETLVRHRIARFEVMFATADGGQMTEHYDRHVAAGDNFVERVGSGVLLMACDRCGHAQDEGTLRISAAGTVCDVCIEVVK